MKDYSDILRLFLERDYRVLEGNPANGQIPWAPQGREVLISIGGLQRRIHLILLSSERWLSTEGEPLQPEVLLEVRDEHGRGPVALSFQEFFDILTNPETSISTSNTDYLQYSVAPSVPPPLVPWES